MDQQSVPQQTIQSEPQPSVVLEKPKKSLSKGPLISIISLSIIATLGISFGIYGFFFKDNNNTSSDIAQTKHDTKEPDCKNTNNSPSISYAEVSELITNYKPTLLFKSPNGGLGDEVLNTNKLPEYYKYLLALQNTDGYEKYSKILEHTKEVPNYEGFKFTDEINYDEINTAHHELFGKNEDAKLVELSANDFNNGYTNFMTQISNKYFDGFYSPCFLPIYLTDADSYAEYSRCGGTMGGHTETYLIKNYTLNNTKLDVELAYIYYNLDTDPNHPTSTYYFQEHIDEFDTFTLNFEYEDDHYILTNINQ